MRILFFAALMLFSLSTHANCWLTKKRDQQGHLYAAIIKGGAPPQGRLCRCDESVRRELPNGMALGAAFDPIIVTLDPESGITSEKPWSEGAEIAQNQRIECRKDQAAIDAAKAAQATERSQRQARRAKRRKLRQDFVQWCIEEFSSRRSKGKEFNTCLSALFKKVFADDQFVELPEDALKSKGGGQ